MCRDSTQDAGMALSVDEYFLALLASTIMVSYVCSEEGVILLVVEVLIRLVIQELPIVLWVVN